MVLSLTRRRFHLLSIFAVIIFTACAIRGVHMKADLPAGLSSSAGEYVDEGYKTLSARNVFLFGAAKWDPADTYDGWLKASPLTQWSYYVSFLASKPDIAAARTVSIVYYSLFLVIYFSLLYSRYTPAIFFGGLMVFGLESTLFFFSRIALFEIPLLTFVYAFVMSFARVPGEKTRVITILFSITVATILAFAIKQSALVYMGPVFVAIGISLLFQHKLVVSVRLVGYLTISLVGIAILLSVTYDIWSVRLDLAPQDYLRRLVNNPLLNVSPFIVLAGLFCAIHGILYHPLLYLKSLYRLTLMALVIVGPMAVALFAYHPLRYYVPLLPAYIFMSLEWLSLRNHPVDFVRPNLVSAVLAVFLLMLFTSYCATAAGVEDEVDITLLAIAVVCIVVLIWVLRRIIFSKKTSVAIVLVLLALGFTQSLIRIAEFLANPSFGAEQVRHELIKRINSEEIIIAGDWAPFFALGTPIRALYTNKELNPPDAVYKIKPQYFLHSDTSSSRYALNALRKHKGISINPPRNLGTYNGSKVEIYPLRYSQ